LTDVPFSENSCTQAFFSSSLPEQTMVIGKLYTTCNKMGVYSVV